MSLIYLENLSDPPLGGGGPTKAALTVLDHDCSDACAIILPLNPQRGPLYIKNDFAIIHKELPVYP